MTYQQIREHANQFYHEKLNNGRTKIFIGSATCGISVGALEVAEAFEKELKKHDLPADIIQVGCLGICLAEPLVYIMKQDNPTICYKNLTPEDASRMVYNYLIEDDPCFDLAIGTLEIKESDIPYIPELEKFEKEERSILRYAGYIDPKEIRDYIALGGFEAMDKAVLHNITVAPIFVWGVDQAEAESNAISLLRKVHLMEKAGKYPVQLSGGEQQRVAVARALAMKPEAMLFDEPTSSLDPEMIEEVLLVVKELVSEGMTTIIATHEMGFARDVSTRVLFLDKGEIVEQGKAQEIFSNPQNDRTKAFLSRFMK